MDHLSFVTILVIAGALLFSLSNGWNDAANAIATAVCTRVLTPFSALMLGAGLNFLGALVSDKVAKTIGKDVADPEFLSQATYLAAVVAATAWVSWCTLKGLPISCSHSLMGALVGAVIASAGWEHVNSGALWKIVYGIFTAPIVGFLLGMAILSGVAWTFRRARPATVNGIFGKLQIVSAGAMAFAHGTGDAQKAMGIIAGALVAGTRKEFEIPLWVRLSCAADGAGHRGRRLERDQDARAPPVEPAAVAGLRGRGRLRRDDPLEHAGRSAAQHHALDHRRDPRRRRRERAAYRAVGRRQEDRLRVAAHLSGLHRGGRTARQGAGGDGDRLKARAACAARWRAGAGACMIAP